MRGQGAQLSPLALVADVYPPAIATSPDLDYQVQSELRLTLMNTSAQPVVFRNDDASEEHGPAMPKHGIHAVTPDRLYVYFPWGGGVGDLTSEPTKIVVTAETAGWHAVQMPPTSSIGVYWLLYPDGEYSLGRHEAISFLFTNIVSESTSAMTLLYAEAHVTGYESLTLTVPVGKEVPLRIVSFTSTPASVLPGRSTVLSWETAGAVATSLAPLGIANGPANGTRKVTPSATTSYTLTAAAIDRTSVEQTVPVAVAAGWQSKWSSAAFGTVSGWPVLFRSLIGYVLFTQQQSDQKWNAWLSEDTQTWEPYTAAFPVPSGAYAWAAQGERIVVADFPGACLHTSSDGADWGAPYGQASFPTSAAGASMAIFDDDVFLLGGGTPQSPLQTVYRWDGNQWTQQTPQWSARSGPGVAVLDDRLYIVGGLGSPTTVTDIWSTDDGTAWTQLAGATLPTLNGFLAQAAGGVVHVLGWQLSPTPFQHLTIANDVLQAVGDAPPLPIVSATYPSAALAAYSGFLLAVADTAYLYAAAPESATADPAGEAAVVAT